MLLEAQLEKQSDNHLAAEELAQVCKHQPSDVFK